MPPPQVELMLPTTYQATTPFPTFTPQAKTKEPPDPQALPTNKERETKEFQKELCRLQRDAAEANMKWEDHLSLNEAKYQRCTRFFRRLSDDSAF